MVATTCPHCGGVHISCPSPNVTVTTQIQEKVNHPQHYGGDTTYEAIKVIEAWELDFCLGNAVKYICRAGKKDKESEIEDLKKASWYLTRRIQQIQTKIQLEKT